MQPQPLQADLFTHLETARHKFLHPTQALQQVTLNEAKRCMDLAASEVRQFQEARQKNDAIRQGKRKRGERVPEHSTKAPKPLGIRQIHIDGFEPDQIWAQAQLIFDAACAEASVLLERFPRKSSVVDRGSGVEERSRVHGHPMVSQSDSNSKGLNEQPEGNDLQVRQGPKDLEAEWNTEDEETVYISADEQFDLDDVTQESDSVQEMEDAEVQQIWEEEMEEDVLRDQEAAMLSEGAEEEVQSDKGSEAAERTEVFIPDKMGLNDGFFSIDDFNRESELLEGQDLRAEQEQDDSEEEQVDWAADPLHASDKTFTAKFGHARTNQEAFSGPTDHDTESSEEEDDGPTFGNADLNGRDSDEVGDHDTDMSSVDDMDAVGQNTNDIKYADFFAPPGRRLTKADRPRALSKTQPSARDPPVDVTAQETDMQRTMAAVHRDIFEDYLTDQDDGAVDDGNGKADTNRSSHQKRQAQLTAEIRRLEAAAVAKRDWTLSGEARANDRPINSLLEEDLEFERGGKPVPIITQEVSEDIEAMIKRRIIAREFDEIVRRRPQNLVTGDAKTADSVRRGRMELSDAKSQKSLAEIYEAEHLEAANPEQYVDKRSEKLKAAHAKVEALWRDVSAKLDTLSSMHFRPKPAQVSINVVSDVPTIAMEDVRPEIGLEYGSTSQSRLAPQELFKAGQGQDRKVEISTKGGLPIAREEMTREQKLRRRRRAKERIRKAGGNGNVAVSSSKTSTSSTKGDSTNTGISDGQGKGKSGSKMKSKTRREQNGIVSDLQKGGVKVIGKKGDLTDLQGRNASVAGPTTTGASVRFKL